jgi:hypothetical protein
LIGDEGMIQGLFQRPSFDDFDPYRPGFALVKAARYNSGFEAKGCGFSQSLCALPNGT